MQGNTSFALALFNQLTVDAGTTDNVFISPYSISNALGMTYVGARGETAQQIMTVLQYPGSGQDIAPEFGALDCQLAANTNVDAGTQLDLANTIYLQTGSALVPEFQSLMTSDFSAPVQFVDFMNHPMEAEDEINQWVSNQTGGEIPQLLSG